MKLFLTMLFLFLGLIANAFGAPIATPDMSDAIDSVTNVFAGVLAVAVLIFGFKKVKSLL